MPRKGSHRSWWGGRQGRGRCRRQGEGRRQRIIRLDNIGDALQKLVQILFIQIGPIGKDFLEALLRAPPHHAVIREYPIDMEEGSNLHGLIVRNLALHIVKRTIQITKSGVDRVRIRGGG